MEVRFGKEVRIDEYAVNDTRHDAQQWQILEI